MLAQPRGLPDRDLNGVVNNHTAFPSAATTFASRLRDSGWVTGYFGKWHMGDQRGRPGFDESASFIGQGQYFDCPFVLDGTTTAATQGWVDDRTGDYAIDFIERNRDRRFAMMVGFKSPHGPQSPPTRLIDRFPGIENVPSPSRTAFAPFDTTPIVEQPGTDGLRNYSQTIVGVDENLGRILDKLDELGLAEDTVVVFASDNGFMLGDHSMGDKRVAYEESIKIPLILRYPRLVPAGAHVDSLVLNIDLAPTLLAFAGLAVPDPMQGGDWRGLVDGSADSLRSQFLYEYFYENPYDIPTIVALRSETHKLVTYPGHSAWVELFDLATDRHETNNLAPLEPSAALLEAMRDQLTDEKAATDYKVPPTADTPP